MVEEHHVTRLTGKLLRQAQNQTKPNETKRNAWRSPAQHSNRFVISVCVVNGRDDEVRACVLIDCLDGSPQDELSS
jgi:hypothetical protein